MQFKNNNCHLQNTCKNKKEIIFNIIFEKCRYLVTITLLLRFFPMYIHKSGKQRNIKDNKAGFLAITGHSMDI